MKKYIKRHKQNGTQKLSINIYWYVQYKYEGGSNPIIHTLRAEQDGRR